MSKWVSSGGREAGRWTVRYKVPKIRWFVTH